MSQAEQGAGTMSEAKQDHVESDKSLTDSPGNEVSGTGAEKTNDDGDVVGGPQESSPDEYPHGFKLGILLVSIYLSVFLVALDRTIIATALPQITDHFNSFADVGWVCLVLATKIQFKLEY